MEEEQKKINFDIDNGDVFYCDEIGVIHTPLKVFLDFKNTTPRVDVRNNQFQPLVTKHNVIVMDPYLAKELIAVLSENLKNYEKKFGKISKPESLEKAQKEAKKLANKSSKANTTRNVSPVYFG